MAPGAGLEWPVAAAAGLELEEPLTSLCGGVVWMGRGPEWPVEAAAAGLELEEPRNHSRRYVRGFFACVDVKETGRRVD
jgi:hypothetical protein